MVQPSGMSWFELGLRPTQSTERKTDVSLGENLVKSYP